MNPDSKELLVKERLAPGHWIRLTAPLQLFPSGSHEENGLPVPLGTEALVLNTGPVGTYLMSGAGEGWVYHHEHDPAQVFQRLPHPPTAVRSQMDVCTPEGCQYRVEARVEMGMVLIAHVRELGTGKRVMELMQDQRGAPAAGVCERLRWLRGGLLQDDLDEVHFDLIAHAWMRALEEVLDGRRASEAPA